MDALNTFQQLPSPAKLNLFLHITGQRADSYHELQTVFQLLDYGDTVDITLRTDRHISVEPMIPGLAPEDNLADKAAKALRTYVEQQTATTLPGATITLHKKLPMGGGIGGGSSNAATVLLGLNVLWKTGLDLDVLAGIGAGIGADVPVFVRGVSAWAEGIGERLSSIELPPRWFVVIKPACSVSTGEIFSHKQLTRDTGMITVAAFLQGGGRNDCQPLVERLYPAVREAVEWLGQYGSAQLTGTGACVFSSFSSEHEARDIFAKRPKQWEGFIAQGVNESPLHSRLRDLH